MQLQLGCCFSGENFITFLLFDISLSIFGYFPTIFFHRQDQLHIDLFVFFSVFFSCFFLFLSVCVVMWKVKQAADLRRAR
jgi:hypothetical protein